MPISVRRSQAPFLAACTVFVLLAGCNAASDGESGLPFSAIAPDETVHFTGTEPFWSGEAAGGTLTYSTPDNPGGWALQVRRFAGRNGLSFSGELDGQDFVMAISPGSCSDGMSDRTYPFDVMLKVAGENRTGCAWSDKHPFTQPKTP